MEIVSVKLITGEEILARFGKVDVDGLVINTPRLMMLVQGKEPGMLGLQLMPWAYSCNQEGDTPPLNMDTVIFVNHNVPKDLEDRYIQETSSIQLVK